MTGIHLDEDCNKLHHVSESGIRLFSSIESETQDLLLQRSGLRYKSSKVFAFTMRQSWGLPLKTGSTNVVIHLRSIRSMSKGGHKISMDIAKTLLKKGIECVPGWQLCRNCYSKQHQILEKNIDSLEEEVNITEIESDFMQDSLRD